jgi:hypothetical protein
MLNYEALGPNQFAGRRNSIVQRLRQQPHADIKGLQKLADTRTDLRQFTGGRKCDNLQVSLVQAIAQTCLLSLNPDPAESMTVSRLAVTNFESAFQGFQRPSSPSNLARWKSERPAHHLPDDFCFGAVVLDDLLRSLLPRSASNQRDIPSSVQTPVFFADDSTAEVYWLKVSRIDDGLEGLYPNVAEMGATVISSDLHVALHSMWTTAEITGFRGLWSLTPKTLLTSNMDAVPDYQFASPVLKGRSLELSALCAFWALRGGIPGDADFQFREPLRLDPEAGATGCLAESAPVATTGLPGAFNVQRVQFSDHKIRAAAKIGLRTVMIPEKRRDEPSADERSEDDQIEILQTEYDGSKNQLMVCPCATARDAFDQLLISNRWRNSYRDQVRVNWESRWK